MLFACVLSAWSIFYLIQKGNISVAEAAVRVSGLEVGGLVGSVSSGWASDLLIKWNPEGGAIGSRLRVAALYVALTAGAICTSCIGLVLVVTTALLPSGCIFVDIRIGTLLFALISFFSRFLCNPYHTSAASHAVAHLRRCGVFSLRPAASSRPLRCRISRT